MRSSTGAEFANVSQEKIAILVDECELPLVRQTRLIQSDLGDLLPMDERFAVVQRLARVSVEQVDRLLIGLIADGNGVQAQRNSLEGSRRFMF